MIGKFRPVHMAIAFGLANAAVAALAQSPAYRQVWGGDFLQGYVADGELIEIRGHGWSDGPDFFYKINIPSAMPPALVDLAGIDAAIQRRLRSECASKGQFGAGCQVVILGKAGPRPRPSVVRSLIASDIEFMPEQ